MNTTPTTRCVRRGLAALIPVLVLLTGACNWGQLHSLPSELVGTWRTDDPRYHSRILNLDSSFVVIGGIDPVRAQHIERVKVSPGTDQTVYTLSLRNEDKTGDELVLEFNPNNGGELHIRNQQKVLWRRSQPAVAHPPPREPSVKIEHRVVYKIDCLYSTCKSD
jgi:hypothetical protein